MSAATAAESFARSEPVLVGANPERAMFVALPAERLSADQLARLRELGRGMVVLGLEDSIAERLRLPSPARARGRRPELQFTASIDAAAVSSSGWSLADQALTMRAAADPMAHPDDLAIPGHVHPVRIGRDELPAGGGAAAAALALARISDQREAVALCAVVDRAGRFVTLERSRSSRELSRLPVVLAAELHAHERARRVEELAVECALPTRSGDFAVTAHFEERNGTTTVALVHGEPAEHPRPSVHVHPACLLADAFGSILCDCRVELTQAIDRIVDEGAGVVVYVKSSPTLHTCGRALPVDPVAIAGLLHHAGVTSLRLDGGDRVLASELRTLGLDVDDNLRSAA